MSDSAKRKKRGLDTKPVSHSADGFSDNSVDSIVGKRANWLVGDEHLPFSTTRLGRILPMLWQATREHGWATTDGGTIFHIPAPLPWRPDHEQWVTPEHRSLFAALSWAWTQAEAGHCRHGIADGPRFVLSFRAVSRGKDSGSGSFHALFGGHDHQRRRAFLDWHGERAVVRSPYHLLALVAEALDSDEITLRTAGLPEGLHFHLSSNPPNWPWEYIGHYDLAILGKKECEDCLGLGYTVDDANRVEERIVRPCPDCCERLMTFNFEDSDEYPWPCADDAAFERYTALRKNLVAALPKKGKAGRKTNEIKVTLSFAPIKPEAAARRWAAIREIAAQVEARQREAERIRKEVCEAPRPKITVDTAVLVADFLQVAVLAGTALHEDDLEVEALPAPHRRPKKLPPGKQAVYVFCSAWDCLKVGKVGPKTEARYVSQHYSHRAAGSTLSYSLLRCDAVQRERLLAGSLPEPAEDTIGVWVEEHTSRYNFLISAEQPPEVLNLLEAFLQCRLKPVFEQRFRE